MLGPHALALGGDVRVLTTHTFELVGAVLRRLEALARFNELVRERWDAASAVSACCSAPAAAASSPAIGEEVAVRVELLLG